MHSVTFDRRKKYLIFLTDHLWTTSRGYSKPNISILHLICGFDDNDANKISTLYFRHLFMPIIYLKHDCEGGTFVWHFIPTEKNIFPEGNARGKYDFCRGKNLHASQTFIIPIDMS